MNFFRRVINILKEIFEEIGSNKVPKLAASLAYFTIFSLPALLLIVMRLSTLFYGQKAIEGKVYGGLARLIGDQTALQVQQVIRNTTFSQSGNFASIVGIVTLILGATGIFGEIQDSINQVWHLKAKPKKGKGVLKLLLNRLLSFSMIAVLAFLLLVSLIANSIMDIFMESLYQRFPDISVLMVYIFNFLVSFLITAILIAVIFKILPDARIKWKDVRPGVIVTTLLLMAGRFLIGFYLGKNRMTTSYGSAGSVVVILLWVYYSAIILYVGAIFTRVYALYRGSHIYPNTYAVWIENKEIISKKAQSANHLSRKPSSK